VSARSNRIGARPLIAAAVLALGVLVTACGSDSRGDHARPPARAGPAPTPAPRLAATPDSVDETPAVGSGGVVSTHLPGMPAGVAAGFGAVWVQAHRGHVVYRIDPRTGRVTAVIAIPDALCSLPRFGAGAVWVFTCNDGDSYKIDPATNAIVRKFRGHGQHSGPPIYGAGSLWMTDSGRVLRRDPRSGIVLTRIRPRIQTTPDSNGAPLAVAHRSLWLYSDAAVSRIDTDTNRVRAVIPLPASKPSGASAGGYCYGGLGAVANGKLWVSNCAGIYEIDPSTDTARLHRLRVGPFSAGGDIYVTAGNGSLWVRTSDTQVTRIDPVRWKVIGRYRASGGGGGIAVAFNRLWVASAGRDRLLRQNIRASEATAAKR